MQSKTCTRCHVEKPFADYGVHGAGRYGLRPACKTCCAEARRKRDERRAPNDCYYRRRLARDPTYAEAIRERNRIRAQQPGYREKVRAAYVKKMSDPAYRVARAETVVLRKRGITREERDALFESQGRRCAICCTDKPHPGKTRGWHIDHDHGTGRVRSILCGNCNNALGYIRENADVARAMAVYIETVCAANVATCG